MPALTLLVHPHHLGGQRIEVIVIVVGVVAGGARSGTHSHINAVRLIGALRRPVADPP